MYVGEEWTEANRKGKKALPVVFLALVAIFAIIYILSAIFGNRDEMPPAGFMQNLLDFSSSLSC